MNNEETKKRSRVLELPDWKRVRIPDGIERLATIAVDAAFRVHAELGPGLLESVYETCLCRELELREVEFQRQLPVPLEYQGVRLEAGFRADVIVGQRLLLEIKAVDALLPVHTAQVITYLRLKKLPLGLLINFNEAMIKHGIHRVLNVPRSPEEKIT
jgi:GxxExxY protein